jgi:hypothetical protein
VLTRPEARRAPIKSAIGWQIRQEHAMTRIDHNTIATDRNDDATTAQLLASDYTIRHIETHHRDGQEHSTIVWNIIDPDELPY